MNQNVELKEGDRAYMVLRDGSKIGMECEGNFLSIRTNGAGGICVTPKTANTINVYMVEPPTAPAADDSAALREALLPFVKYCNTISADENDETPAVRILGSDDKLRVAITVGQFRAARALLAKLDSPK